MLRCLLIESYPSQVMCLHLGVAVEKLDAPHQTPTHCVCCHDDTQLHIRPAYLWELVEYCCGFLGDDEFFSELDVCMSS